MATPFGCGGDDRLVGGDEDRRIGGEDERLGRGGGDRFGGGDPLTVEEGIPSMLISQAGKPSLFGSGGIFTCNYTAGGGTLFDFVINVFLVYVNFESLH